MTVITAILLPFLQPREDATGPLILESSSALIASAAPGVALSTRSVDVAWWILAVAVTGIVFRLMWLGLGVIRLRHIIAGATPAPSFDAVAGDLMAALGTRADLTITDEIDTPATVGVRRAIVLLPRRLMALPAAVQRAVIAHELLHVKRRDWLHTLAEECGCALLWFHPAARVIAQRLSLAREMVVDEATILLTRDRRAYAEALMAFANPPPQVAGITPLIGRRFLSQRLSMIGQEVAMSPRHLYVRFAAALILCAVATASAVDAFPMIAGAQPGRVYDPGRDAGITLPEVVHEVKPVYTPAAMQQKIQGSVHVDVVVLASGEVGRVWVTRSLDAEYGLDQEAMRAAGQWRFTPGRKDGTPVPVVVTIEMTFTLR
jgi:TonB family protein